MFRGNCHDNQNAGHSDQVCMAGSSFLNVDMIYVSTNNKDIVRQATGKTISII